MGIEFDCLELTQKPDMATDISNPATPLIGLEAELKHDWNLW